MAEEADVKPPFHAETTAWAQVALGYSMAAVGLIVNLTSMAWSGFPDVAGLTAVLSGLGILLVTAGMLQLRRCADRTGRAARRALAMQSFGLVLLLIGELALSFSSELRVLLASAVFIVTAAALALGGAFVLRGHHVEMGATNRRGVDYLVLGTALIFAGVGAIVFSKIGYYFVLSDLASLLINVVGVTATACGCVVAAYAFVVPWSATEMITAG